LLQRDTAVGRGPHAMPPDTVRSLRQLTARL
jgi:hypothetical protein